VKGLARCACAALMVFLSSATFVPTFCLAQPGSFNPTSAEHAYMQLENGDKSGLANAAALVPTILRDKSGRSTLFVSTSDFPPVPPDPGVTAVRHLIVGLVDYAGKAAHSGDWAGFHKALALALSLMSWLTDVTAPVSIHHGSSVVARSELSMMPVIALGAGLDELANTMLEVSTLNKGDNRCLRDLAVKALTVDRSMKPALHAPYTAHTAKVDAMTKKGVKNPMAVEDPAFEKANVHEQAALRPQIASLSAALSRAMSCLAHTDLATGNQH